MRCIGGIEVAIDKWCFGDFVSGECQEGVASVQRTADGGAITE
jgi:hypothetical protein